MGEDFTVKEGETKTQTYQQTVDAKWNTENLSIVAFVYNGNGVEQAVKVKVKSEKWKICYRSEKYKWK